MRSVQHRVAASYGHSFLIQPQTNQLTIMSHFSVMVFEDPSMGIEKQLEPFHEFECTGEDNQYVEDVDITDKVMDTLAEYVSEGERQNPLTWSLEYHGLSSVSEESEIELDGEHKYGFAIVKDGKLVKAIKRTNPNAKWDWWVEGGRWRNFLKLKTEDPRYVDSAPKSQIDWEGMRNEAEKEAEEKWDKIIKLAPDLWESWKSVRERIGVENIEEARNFYHNQPGRQALKEDRDLFWEEDEVLVGRERYIEKCRNQAISTFAMVKDGKWWERGEMGWYGISTNEVPEEDWFRTVWEAIQSAPDDTVIHIVDCHI